MMKNSKLMNMLWVCCVATVLASCTGAKEEEKGTGTGTGPNGEPGVISMPGGSVLAKASLTPVTITSQTIFNELEQQVRDNYEFVVTPETGSGITVALVGGTNFTDSLAVKSVGGKIQFDAKLPTKSGAYRIAVKPANSTATGRFFVTVDPGPVAMLGGIQGVRWEDRPDANGNYNNVKDPDESWSILGDGLTTTFLSVGPIMDSFSNNVNTAKIKLTAGNGAIISENPAQITDGRGFFTFQSFEGTGLVALSAVALDAQETPITAPIVGQIQVVQPHLQIAETGNFGNVFVNETAERIFTVTNIGSTAARSVVYNAEQPFLIKNTSSCLVKVTLRPQESCQLIIQFTGGIRATFTGALKVIGTPANIPTSQTQVNLVAKAVIRAQMNLSNINLDFGTKLCGYSYTEEIILTNSGDLPGENFTITNPPPHPGQTVPFITFASPAPTGTQTTDPAVPINCGATLPPGRQCRIVATFHPQALVSNAPLTATFSIDGQPSVNLSVRGASQPGPPVGNIPIILTTPDEQSQVKQLPADEMNLSQVEITSVSVGPIRDACGTTVANGYEINAAVSAGTLVNSTEITNNGVATFAWKGSIDAEKIGPQTITVTSETALGTKVLTFRGVRMVMTGPSDLGQILTTKPRMYEYTITNSGNLPVQNLEMKTDPTNMSWGNIDFTHQGGCQDFTLLAGETCTVRFRAAPASPGGYTGKIVAQSLQGVGQNSQTITLNALAQIPPVLRFLSTSYSLGNFIAGTPITGVLDFKNDGPATANNLAYSVAAPFVITQNDCPTTLVGGGTCKIYIQLSTNIKGTYSTSMQVTSEANSANANISASIGPNKPSGTLAMTFDKTSVPASIDTNARINVVVGPIKDQYGNVVLTGTKVVLSTTAGKMNVDLDNNLTETMLTDANGLVSFNIRAYSSSEITNFTLNAKVFDTDNTTLLLETSKSGSFTGARLAFVESSVVFGQVALGRLEIKTVTLKNNGNETASAISLSTGSSDFPLSGQSACTSLVAGASCSFSVTFFPAQVGIKTSVISVNASGNGVLSASIPVSGEGVLPADISISPSTITMDLPPGNVGTTSFTITNGGAEALTSLSISSNVRNSEFTFGGVTACQTLGGGQSCVINVSFTPATQLVGNISSIITASGQSPSRPTVSSMSLTIRPATLIFKQKPNSLAVEACGALQVEAQNNTQAPINAVNTISLVLSTIGGTGAFYSDNNCTSTIGSIPLNSGNSATAVFYYKGLTGGDHTITASNTVFAVQSIIKVYSPLAFTEENPQVAAGGIYTFSTTGGALPVSYAVRTPSGGSIVASAGEYTAPNVAGTYVIRATDNLGNFVETNVLVYNPVMVAGNGYVCYSTNGDLTCWGQNAFGQWNINKAVYGTYLEKVPTLSRVTTTPVSGKINYMYSGANHMCYVRASDNALYCQGLNNVGQLGNNTVNDSASGVAVSGSFKVPVSADMTGLVSSGFGDHTCAIKSTDNQAYCWGSNDSGQISPASTPYANLGNSKYLTPVKVTLPGSNTAVQVATSRSNTCVLQSDSTIMCFGTGSAKGDNGSTGSTSLGYVRNSGNVIMNVFKQISSGLEHFCALSINNEVYCWGQGFSGQIGDGTSNSRAFAVLSTSSVKKVYSGANHNCVVKLDGSVQCWGANFRGAIGDGSTSNRSNPVAISGVGTVNSMALGRDFSCAISGTQVKCWGDNSYGVLLESPATSRFVPGTLGMSSTTCSAGMNYNPTDFSCKCATASNIYSGSSSGGYCSAAPAMYNFMTTSFGAFPAYADAGTQVKFQLSVSSQVSGSDTSVSDVPVHFVNILGNGTFNYARLLTNSSGTVTNAFYKSSDQTDTFESRIGNSLTQQQSTTVSKPIPCNLPWGGSIAQGQSVTAYKAGTFLNCEGGAPYETRTCSGGVLSGSFTSSSPSSRDCNCYSGAVQVGWYAHGSVIYFRNGGVCAPAWVGTPATCNNGRLTTIADVTDGWATGAFWFGSCRAIAIPPNASGR